MISFGIVGSGYRAEYFGRIARTYPDIFRAIYLCRSEEKVARMTSHTGMAATMDRESFLAFGPDFLVIAVDRGHMAEETLKWAEQGIPVITETPSGATEEELKRLWEAQARGARISCSEQYYRQPLLAAGLRAVEEGKIGTPESVYISLLHHYHGASLIRKALKLCPGEGYTLRGERTVTEVAATDCRESAIYDGRPQAEERERYHIAFESGKQADYDFAPIQYRTYLRSRHLTVRGSRGEWNDTLVRYLAEDGTPRQEMLLPEIPEKYRCLDNQSLRDLRRNWKADLAPDTVQDEFAIATMLMDMGDWSRGGEAPYPLEEALEDALMWLMMNKAAENPWQAVTAPRMPWHGEKGNLSAFADREEGK